jgi:tRNA dimethylallyltransferase
MGWDKTNSVPGHGRRGSASEGRKTAEFGVEGPAILAAVADLADQSMSEGSQSKLLAIIGATGSGKSSLAMALARRTGAEILSVDAMQIYQGMNIGTAKPTAEEQREVRHHLVDWVRPDETFSVARFAALAGEVIADAQRRGVPLIAVGGTPLYFKALFYGLFEGPSADAGVRERLAVLSGKELHERLQSVDPAAAERIHASDRKRLIRALEVFELTGRPISSFQTEWESEQVPRYPAVWVGLRWETSALNRRLNARAKEMIAAGWVEEVRRLDSLYSPWSQTAGAATGYERLLEHIRGRVSLDEAMEEIKIATRQLARRQMKWFKRFPGVHWLDGERALEENVGEAMRLSEKGE